MKEKGFRGQHRAPEPSQGSRPAPNLRQRHRSQLPLQGGAQRTLSNVTEMRKGIEWSMKVCIYNEYTIYILIIYIQYLLHIYDHSYAYRSYPVLLEEGFHSKCEVPQSEAITHLTQKSIASMMLLGRTSCALQRQKEMNPSISTRDLGIRAGIIPTPRFSNDAQDPCQCPCLVTFTDLTRS